MSETGSTARRIARVSNLMIWFITLGVAVLVATYCSVWLVPG